MDLVGHRALSLGPLFLTAGNLTVHALYLPAPAAVLCYLKACALNMLRTHGHDEHSTMICTCGHAKPAHMLLDMQVIIET